MGHLSGRMSDMLARVAKTHNCTASAYYSGADHVEVKSCLPGRITGHTHVANSRRDEVVIKGRTLASL